ncbi:hypothetical protein PSHT_02791 [Puccinia striiformis]|uniref:Uncharacterized protein n=1 Tax=Puccinia striiformis TaxID=27350 RepID=A0A2S4WH60_9BASI|nr:hypothetical protein PSHT_02791 [Puccinia striiformis]
MNFKHKSEVKYDGILKIVQEMESKEKSSNLEEIKEEYDQRISNQLNELQMFILHPMEQLKLQNDKEIWDQVNLVTYQDFSSISLSNATLLVAFLEKAQDYCMTKTNRDEKEEIFKLLVQKIPIAADPQCFTLPREAEKYLSESALKKSMVLSCSHAKGLIEAEILIMVEMLNKGQITAYLSANVGKLIMK